MWLKMKIKAKERKEELENKKTWENKRKEKKSIERLKRFAKNIYNSFLICLLLLAINKSCPPILNYFYIKKDSSYSNYKIEEEKKLKIKVEDIKKEEVEGIIKAKKLLIEQLNGKEELNKDKKERYKEVFIFGVMHSEKYKKLHSIFFVKFIKNIIEYENEKILIAMESLRWLTSIPFFGYESCDKEDYFCTISKEINKYHKNIIFADIEGRDLNSYNIIRFNLEKNSLDFASIFKFSIEERWRFFPFISLRADVSFANSIKSLLNEYGEVNKMLVVIGAAHVEGTVKALEQGIEVARNEGMSRNIIVLENNGEIRKIWY